MPSPKISFVPVASLRHIEGFSRRRVEWLAKKIMSEGVWRVPLVLEREHYLAMDGQHRMEVAKKLDLAVVPALLYRYDEVDVWSLRPGKYTVSGPEIVSRAMSGDIYPYKTAKHRFPCGELPELAIPLAALFDERLAGRAYSQAA
jgi:hypothetical protein